MIATPMIPLTKKGVEFIWFDACEQSFHLVKQQIMSARVLRLPNAQLEVRSGYVNT